MPTYVIGGGVIGLLSAYELALAGRSVVVIERGQAGREASWAGGGILSPLYPWRYPEPITRLALWGERRYPALVEALRLEGGVDAEWTRSGMLSLAVSDVDLALAWARQHAIPLELINDSALRVLEPSLAAEGPAVWDEALAQVRNPRLLAALKQVLRKRGVDIRENTAVEGVVARNGRLAALRTAQGELAAQQCLVAAGAWAGALLARTGLSLPIRPVRGQMLLFRAIPGLVKRIVLKDSRYLVPRRDGHVLAGSTVEEVGFDRATTAIAREELRAAAIALVPALGNYEVEHHWAGLRPGSPDGIPYIGEHPDIRGLFVNAGHYRNGIVLAPASARLAADLMLGREPLLDPTPYALARAV
jgi:glycine oxidase